MNSMPPPATCATCATCAEAAQCPTENATPPTIPCAGGNGRAATAPEATSPAAAPAESADSAKAARSAPATTGSAYAATRNACHLCTPLGATLAFRGFAGAVPFLHGSQGCATYIRRYAISHFREPLDVASSSFGESAVVFGGRDNLHQGLDNVIRQYRPEMIGIATTCLAETIGDDVNLFLHEFRTARDQSKLPILVPVSTPSYSGTHIAGFHRAVRAVVKRLADRGAPPNRGVAVLPGMVSPADLRHLRELFRAFGLRPVLLPDYSDTLDGPAWAEYHPIPPGGTELEMVRRLPGSRAAVAFGRCHDIDDCAGQWLHQQCQVPLHRHHLPVGLQLTDRFVDTLEAIAGDHLPEPIAAARARLVDAMVDGHKYLAQKQVVVYGEPDLVLATTAFLAEIGTRPVLVATGGETGTLLRDQLPAVMSGRDLPEIIEDADFATIDERLDALQPDLLVGNSKGFKSARRLGIPLVRIGFPIHDRFGAQRLLHLGYTGALGLLDRVVNAVIAHTQDSSEVGYTYY